MGNSARAGLAASSQAWEVNNVQCDCCDLYRTAVRGWGGRIIAQVAVSDFQQTDKDLFILLSFLLEMDALSDEPQILQPLSEEGQN